MRVSLLADTGRLGRACPRFLHPEFHGVKVRLGPRHFQAFHLAVIPLKLAGREASQIRAIAWAL